VCPMAHQARILAFVNYSGVLPPFSKPDPRDYLLSGHTNLSRFVFGGEDSILESDKMRICEWQPGATVACEVDRKARHITFRYIDGWAFQVQVVSASAFTD
jgi:hypothetical protein